MAGISSKALSFGDPKNLKKFNSIEEIGEFDLQDLDAKFREYDPQIGRWWEIDPKSNKMELWSPYSAMYNNPIKFSDQFGDEPEGDEKYKIKEGDNLSNIAKANNTTVEAILKANTNIKDPNNIQIGQEIIIPVASSNQNETKLAFAKPVEGLAKVPHFNIQPLECGVGSRWGILIKEVFTKIFSSVGKSGLKQYSKAMYRAFEEQLSSDGLKSILKSQRNIEKQLVSHLEKLAEIKKVGGHSSSVEKEIKNFQAQLQAIKDLLQK